MVSAHPLAVAFVKTKIDNPLPMQYLWYMNCCNSYVDRPFIGSNYPSMNGVMFQCSFTIFSTWHKGWQPKLMPYAYDAMSSNTVCCQVSFNLKFMDFYLFLFVFCYRYSIMDTGFGKMSDSIIRRHILSWISIWKRGLIWKRPSLSATSIRSEQMEVRRYWPIRSCCKFPWLCLIRGDEKKCQHVLTTTERPDRTWLWHRLRARAHRSTDTAYLNARRLFIAAEGGSAVGLGHDCQIKVYLHWSFTH